MTKKKQFAKNLDLSEKLANFLAKHPQGMDKTSDKTSFVAFSSSDNELNKENNKLIESLLQEGRKVIKAQETKDKQNPWQFTSITI